MAATADLNVKVNVEGPLDARQQARVAALRVSREVLNDKPPAPVFAGTPSRLGATIDDLIRVADWIVGPSIAGHEWAVVSGPATVLVDGVPMDASADLEPDRVAVDYHDLDTITHEASSRLNLDDAAGGNLYEAWKALNAAVTDHEELADTVPVTVNVDDLGLVLAEADTWTDATAPVLDARERLTAAVDA